MANIAPMLKRGSIPCIRTLPIVLGTFFFWNKPFKPRKGQYIVRTLLAVASS